MSGLGGLVRPAMRGYLIPLAAGLLLTASTFLPWVVIGDTVLTPEQSGVGIDDVHSSSELIGSDGTPYNTW